MVGTTTARDGGAGSGRARSASSSAADASWWRQAVVYEVYPRSFADGDDDGVGDLSGLLSRVDYLASLGVDAVWLTPFYPSALADGGYDVDDHRDVDPLVGTIEQFAAVVAALHERGIRVMVDIVPNHSSNRHSSFRQALAARPGSVERDRYVFRDGTGADGEMPPSDWRSFIGGPAWTRVVEPDGTPGQWYLHLFAPEQPDWNWSNPAVRADFLKTLRFWADHGVDGFRIDTASLLAKDLAEPLPAWDLVAAGNPLLGGGVSSFPPGQHPFEDRDELDDIYGEWRQLFDEYDPPLFAVAEASVEPERRHRYAGPDRLGQIFDFALLTAAWDAAAYHRAIRSSLGVARSDGATTTWVLSNHDVVRHATRLAVGDGSRQALALPQPESMTDAVRRAGAARAAAATLLILALPGSSYLYQGEELGLPEVLDIAEADARDPAARYEHGTAVQGRDGCRVPLPWTSDGTAFGFSSKSGWLPQPDWFARYSIEIEDDDPRSSLTMYRTALRLRRRLQGVEELRWLDLGPHVLAFSRPGGWTSITNFGPDPIPLPDGQLLIRTDSEGSPLAADATAWLIIHDSTGEPRA